MMEPSDYPDYPDDTGQTQSKTQSVFSLKAKPVSRAVKADQFQIKARLKSAKGAPVIVDEQNFMYLIYKKVELSSGTRTHLRCRAWDKAVKCPARAWIDGSNNDVISSVTCHNHLSDAPMVSAKLAEQKFLEKAIDNPLLKPRALFGEMVAQRSLLPNERMALKDKVEPVNRNITQISLKYQISLFYNLFTNERTNELF